MLCFCKQKTAYELRISDWSSDVCSSDLLHIGQDRDLIADRQAEAELLTVAVIVAAGEVVVAAGIPLDAEEQAVDAMDVFAAQSEAVELRRLLVVVFLRVVAAARLPAVLRREHGGVASAQLELYGRNQGVIGDRKSVGVGKSGTVRVD